MLMWAAWRGDAAAWDHQIIEFTDYSVFQSYAWGEHRRNFGWHPHRLVGADDGRPVAAAQVMVRRFPGGVALAWVPGGPVGSIAAWDSSFRSAIQRAAGGFQLYCRVNPTRPIAMDDVERMRTMGWRRPITPMLSGLSVVYAPAVDEATREASASRNWRHNLRRSRKHDHIATVWRTPSADDISLVYAAMQTHKGLPEQTSREAIASLLESFGDRCLVVRCDDSAGKLLAVRGALLFGDRGWDMLAAATSEARQVYATHATFWELMTQVAARGIAWYDMSGVDPVANKGVSDFKKGTGAIDLAYLGEWDWGSNALLRRVADRLVARRSRAM